VAAYRPRICVPITGPDMETAAAEPLADLFEVRIDLVGGGWRQVTERLKKPWLACNRRAAEGGGWRGDEAGRIEELLVAAGLGAGIIDIELAAPDLRVIIKEVKGRAECLVSHHDLESTPPLEQLREIVGRQMAAGADICKVVTTARNFTDNITVLRLIREFPGSKIVAFAMGEAGRLSRVLAPLAGGYFTYASLAAGRESAAGQITVGEMREIYGMLEDADK
jgi:3-dehydroquinate dehydratase-1